MDRIPDIENRVIFEDDDLLVFDKPYDIPSTGKALEDDECVQFWLKKRQGRMIWAVHQLDADTTGLNLFVKKKELVKVYKGYLEDAGTSKLYLVFVHGAPSWDVIKVDSPIGYIDSRSLGVCASGRSALSEFDVLERTAGFALIKARIFTGRTHQIRIHLSHLGHPLIGEEWYRQPPCDMHCRQALHAWRIELNSEPKTNFTAPVPKDFIELANRLGLSLNHLGD